MTIPAEIGKTDRHGIEPEGRSPARSREEQGSLALNIQEDRMHCIMGVVVTLVWLALFPQQCIFVSDTLHTHAAVAGLVSLAAGIVWAAVWGRASAVVHARWLLVACGFVSCVAGASLVVSPGGAASIALFAIAVFAGAPLGFHWFARAGELARHDISFAVGCALVAAGVLHAMVRLFVGSSGSFSNVGQFNLCGMTALSLLPVLSGLVSLGGKRRSLIRSRSSARVEEGAWSAAPVEMPPMRSLRQATAGEQFELILGALSLTVMVVVLFFAGASTAPYRVNILASLDGMACILVLVGALFAVASRMRGLSSPLRTGIELTLLLALSLSCLLAPVAVGELYAAEPISALFAAAAALSMFSWQVLCRSTRGMGSLELAAATLSSAGVVSARFFGVAFKRAIGIDMHVIALCALVITTILLAMLGIAVAATAVTAQRSMRIVEEERERARQEAQDAKENVQAAVARAVAEASEVATASARSNVHDQVQAFYEARRLSAREVQVAMMLFEGSTMNEIAAEAGISFHTVRYHARNVYAKLGVANKKGLRAAVEEHLAGLAEDGIAASLHGPESAEPSFALRESPNSESRQELRAGAKMPDEARP